MSRIRNRDTKPEIVVRSIVHRLGYRYRLHKGGLPGKPNIVLVRHGKIINVHGCFFHMHLCKYGRDVPATNAEFWLTKRMSNVERDRRNLRWLKKGWLESNDSVGVRNERPKWVSQKNNEVPFHQVTVSGIRQANTSGAQEVTLRSSFK